MLSSPRQGATTALATQRCGSPFAFHLVTIPFPLCFLHSSPQPRRADSLTSAVSPLCTSDGSISEPAAAAAGQSLAVHRGNQRLGPSLMAGFTASRCQGWTRCHWVSLENICTGFWDLNDWFFLTHMVYSPCGLAYSLFKISC